MKISEIGSVAIPQNAVNMKSKMHEEVPQSQEQGTNEVLTNPMETVGRSQVNFRGARRLVKALSTDELNMIAEYAAREGLSRREISVGKQALIDTTNEYKCTSAHALARKYGKMLDKEDDAVYKIDKIFEKNVFKIDSGMNPYRVDFIDVLKDFNEWVKNNKTIC